MTAEMRQSEESLIVLNNDTVVCDDCYELNAPSETAPEVDPGQVPFGRTLVGQCSSCGLTLRGRSGGRQRREQ